MSTWRLEVSNLDDADMRAMMLEDLAGDRPYPVDLELVDTLRTNLRLARNITEDL
jgi:hypothetical protein